MYTRLGQHILYLVIAGRLSYRRDQNVSWYLIWLRDKDYYVWVSALMTPIIAC